MKSTFVSNGENSKKIDWSKKNIVKGVSGSIVMSTGQHTGVDFTGFVLYKSEEGGYDVGEHVGYFKKEAFTLCEQPVTITFEN